MAKLMQWLKFAARRLKQSILALYYACEHREVSIWPKLIAGFALAYALSPIDLIPDFIPVLGMLDDLILLPGLIALAVWMIPPHVMDSARARAASAPIKLDQSLAGLSAIFVLWDVGVLLSIDWAMKYLLPEWWKGASLVVLCSITIGLAGAQIIWWLGVSKQHQEKSA